MADKMDDLDANMEAAARGLSVAEVNAAKKKARDAVEAKRKKAALDRIVEEETLRLQQEEGLVSGDEIKDEMVNITIDLAEHSSHLSLNMNQYWHGHTYTVPRHVADTMREMMQRGWKHQHEIEGKGMTQHFLQTRDTVLTPVGATNAPRAFA